MYDITRVVNELAGESETSCEARPHDRASGSAWVGEKGCDAIMVTKQTKLYTITAGFSLFLLSTAFTFWGGIYSFMLVPYNTDFILFYYSIPLFISFVVATVVLSFICTKNGARTVLFGAIGSGMFIIIGVIAILMLGGRVGNETVLLSMTGLSFGMGSASAFISWEYVLGTLRQEDIKKALLLCMLVFPIIYLIITNIGIPASLFGYVLVLLVSVATFLLVYQIATTAKIQKKHVDKDREFLRKSHFVFKHNRGLLLCFVCVAFIAAITRCIALGDPLSREMVKYGSIVAVLLMGVVTILVLRVVKIKLNYPRLYMVIFPVFATGLLLLPLMNTTYQIVFASVTFAFFLACLLLIMYQSIEMSKSFDIAPVTIFAVFNSTAYLTMGIGTFLGTRLLVNNDFSFSMLSVVALFLVYILVMAETIIGRFKDKGLVNPTETIDFGSIGTDSMKGYCEVFSRYSDFSKREMEVLLLLAKGRDVPFISETLFISKNTVRTHIKNIYRKTNTHNRQELLSKIEQVVSQ